MPPARGKPGGPLAVDGPQRVVGKEGLEDRLGKDGVDPLHDARGDNSGLLSGGGFVDDFGLSEVVGDLLLFVVRDEHEEVVKVAQVELSEFEARAARRVGVGAANGGRDVVNVDCAV